MKIGVMSDLHLGHRQYGLYDREQDFYTQLQNCVTELNKHNCDIIIIAGDIFDKPNPSPEAIHQYFDKISNLDADVIISIKGNHTMLLRDNHYSVDELIADEMDFGYFLLQDERWSGKDFALASPYDKDFSKWKNSKINVDGITYRGPSQLNEFIDLQKKMASDIDDIDAFNILVVHQSFKEFCGFTGEELSINDIELSPYNVIICGHIHSRVDVQLNNDTLFLQPGSIERLNTEEARDEQRKGKGVYVIDTETNKCKFYQVTCPRKFFLGEFNVESTEVEEYIEILQEQIDKCETKPIVALKFYDADTMWDSVKSFNNVLINNSKVIVEDKDINTDVLTENEIPSVVDAVQSVAKNNFSTQNAQLCIELFEVLNDKDKDPMELLKKFEKQQYSNDDKEEEFVVDTEVQEIYDYFEKLEVK